MIRILTDSTSSLKADFAREHDFGIVSLFVNYDGIEYVESEMDVDDFYTKIYDMIENVPKSSQPSQMDFTRFFEEAAEAGDDVLGVFVGTGFSGTLEGAVRAARAVKSSHLDFNCIFVDSTTNSYDEAFPVIAALEAREAGADLEGCAKAAAETVVRSRIMFVPETLKFLQAGGRIGNVAALLGNIIQVLPVVTVSDGVATTLCKVRTKKKSQGAMFKQFVEDAEQYGLVDVRVHYIGDKTEATEWAAKVIEPFVGHEVPVTPVSPVIGCHVGPAVGISYRCENVLPGKWSKTISDLITTV